MNGILFAIILAILSTPNLAYSADVNAEASPTSGTAPLAVFFNSDLNDGNATFSDYLYVWDFGDNSTVTWGTTGELKNVDYGPVTYHLYEDAGSYTATLTVYSDATTEVPSLAESFNITVTDADITYPTTSTTCINDTTPGTDWSGCPSGANQVTVDDLSASLQGYLGAGERVLLHRGSAFTSNDETVDDSVNTGPTTLGAYGTCTLPDPVTGICANAPTIQIIHDASASRDGFINLTEKHDWRIMDITFTAATSDSGAIVAGATDLRNILGLRLKYHGSTNTAFGWTHWRQHEGDSIRHNSLVSSDIQEGQGMQIYMGAEPVAVLGNNLHNSRLTHVARIFQGYKAVFNHNICSGASLDNSNGRHALKFHGPKDDTEVGDYATTGGSGLEFPSNYIVIRDNIFGSSGPWPVSIGPQDSSSDERITNLIFEKNRVISEYGDTSTTLPQVGVMAEGRHITIRNNIMDGSGGHSGEYTGIAIERRGIEPTPSFNYIYNNTIYNSDNIGTGMIGVAVDITATNTFIKNNLVSFPNETSETLISDDSANATSSNNVLIDDPNFVDPDNATPLSRDFSVISPSTSVIDQGTSVNIFNDFDLVTRPVGLYDIGAYEFFIAPPQAPVIGINKGGFLSITKGSGFAITK